jgi:predicted nuclease of predicted toxin-antitoxin system
MKFKIDENLSIEVAQLLREAQYHAVTVLEQNLGGKPDSDIARICQGEERCLITLDRDFADIRTYPPEEYSGLIILRLNRLDKYYVLNVITKLIKTLGKEPLKGYLWIVEEDRIRIRGRSNFPG